MSYITPAQMQRVLTTIFGPLTDRLDKIVENLDKINESVLNLEIFPADGATYGIRNRQPEIIAGDGEAVCVYDQEASATLATPNVSAPQIPAPEASTEQKDDDDLNSLPEADTADIPGDD